MLILDTLDLPAIDEGPVEQAHRIRSNVANCAHWRSRLAALRSAGDLSPFLEQCRIAIPAYRQVSMSSMAVWNSTPWADRRQHSRCPSLFRSNVSGDDGYPVHTSGTTGAPMEIVLDEASYFQACEGYTNEFRIWEASEGPLFEPGAPAILMVTNKSHRSRIVFPMVSARGSIFRRLVVGRSVDEDRGLLREIASFDSAILYSKASYLRDLMALERRTGAERSALTPRLIAHHGEPLFADDRRQLTAWFGCPVFETYASKEGGMIAMECPRHRGLHVCRDAVRLEVLRPDGHIADEGFGELVVTNGLNWMTAFVRYRTGDWGTVVAGPCVCGYVGTTIADMRGREAVAFSDARGGDVDPRVLEPALGALPVIRYQVRQDVTARCTFTYISVTELDRASITLIVDAITDRLGDVGVTVVRVPWLLARGGKDRRFIVDRPRSIEPLVSPVAPND